MFYHLLESSHWDDSNKWSNIAFDEGITQEESIEVKFAQKDNISDDVTVNNVTFRQKIHEYAQKQCDVFFK